MILHVPAAWLHIFTYRIPDYTEFLPIGLQRQCRITEVAEGIRIQVCVILAMWLLHSKATKCYIHPCELPMWCSLPGRNICTGDETRSSAAAEIARVGLQYAVQGHSRSLILVLIESPHICDFLLMNNTSDENETLRRPQIETFDIGSETERDNFSRYKHAVCVSKLQRV